MLFLACCFANGYHVSLSWPSLWLFKLGKIIEYEILEQLNATDAEIAKTKELAETEKECNARLQA